MPLVGKYGKRESRRSQAGARQRQPNSSVNFEHVCLARLRLAAVTSEPQKRGSRISKFTSETSGWGLRDPKLEYLAYPCRMRVVSHLAFTNGPCGPTLHIVDPVAVTV